MHLLIYVMHLLCYVIQMKENNILCFLTELILQKGYPNSRPETVLITECHWWK